MSDRFPYYDLVPKDRAKNLRFRIAVRERCLVDADYRAAIKQMCEQDVLLWMQLFCFVFEPRKEKGRKNKPRILPFILWPHQEENGKIAEQLWGVEDFMAEKSRAEGVSWYFLNRGLYSWLHEPLFVMGLISKDVDSVDKKGDLNALMPKLDWQLTKLPYWMLGRFNPRNDRTYTDHKLVNPNNGAIIVGYSATGDAASGGRTTVFFKDERAKFPREVDQDLEDSLQHVTNCQIDVSTPKGDSGVFYDKAHDGTTVKLIYDWKDNPTKNQGLYRVEDGEIIVVDPDNNPLPPGYLEQLPTIHAQLEKKGFAVEGTTRSPWYNRECLRSGKPVSVAQELDRSYGRSEESPFDKGKIEKFAVILCREPLLRGIIKVNDQIEATFQPTANGQAKLWCPLSGATLSPPKRAYGAGVDIGFGTGGDNTSNSVLIVGDLATGEQVFEFVSYSMLLPDFVRMVVAVCKWFYGATLNWDSNGGAGGTMTKYLERYDYWNIHYTEAVESGRDRNPAKKAGTWNHTDEAKAVYLGETLEDVFTKDLVPRSLLTLMEFCQYGFKNGVIVHKRAQRTKSEGSKGKAHGDSATGLAMFNIVRRYMAGTLEPTPERPPTGDWRTAPDVTWSCPAMRLKANLRRNDRSRTGPYANRP